MDIRLVEIKLTLSENMEILEKVSICNCKIDCNCYSGVYSLPNDKFLDWSKLKAFADDKINVT